jgi:hypothetical protein
MSITKSRLNSYKKAASGVPDAASANAVLGTLEREINPRTDHAEVILWPVHKIPTEIADPANVRGEANLHAAADLADCPRLRIRTTNRLEDVEALAPIANKPTGSCYRSVAWLAFAKKPIDRPLATAKDPAGTAKDVR